MWDQTKEEESKRKKSNMYLSTAHWEVKETETGRQTVCYNVTDVRIPHSKCQFDPTQQCCDRILNTNRASGIWIFDFSL